MGDMADWVNNDTPRDDSPTREEVLEDQLNEARHRYSRMRETWFKMKQQRDEALARLREAKALIEDIYGTHRDRDDPDSDWECRDGVWADEKCAWCTDTEAWQDKVKELL